MIDMLSKFVDKGIAQGLEQGLAQGLNLGRAETARNMIADNMAPELIAKYTGFSLDRIGTMASELGMNGR